MPSSYTPQLRLEQQFTGENVNTWGVLLNAVLARLDTAVAGMKTIALTGNYTLSVANAADDEARAAILKTTGTGAFAITVPSVSKLYAVWNTCTGILTVTTGAGTTVAVQPGEATLIFSDGANVKRLVSQDMGGLTISNLGSPASATDAATKKYVDDQAFAVSSGQLPGQSGSAGQLLGTNGTVAGWTNVLPTLTAVGGSTNAYPALRRSGATLEIALGDNSGLASLNAGNLTINSQPVATQAFAVAAAIVL